MWDRAGRPHHDAAVEVGGGVPQCGQDGGVQLAGCRRLADLQAADRAGVDARLCITNGFFLTAGVASRVFQRHPHSAIILLVPLLRLVVYAIDLALPGHLVSAGWYLGWERTSS